MASSTYIKIGNTDDTPTGLHFQDSVYVDDDEIAQDSYTKFPDQPAEGENADLLTGEKKQPSFWTFEYYQQFFDVDTNQVLYRLFGSFVPKLHSNYLETHIRPKPDLYGPFWVCCTLVFTIAISGDLSSLINSKGISLLSWQSDFRKISVAATVIFSYAWLIPLALWGLLWYRGSPAQYTFLDIACLYGYSLSIFIPVSILWVIPYLWFQWLLLILATLASGFVLVWAFWPAVRDEEKKIIGLVAMVIVGLLHLTLAVGFMLYFFKHGDSAVVVPLNTTVSAKDTVTTTIKAITTSLKTVNAAQ